MVANHVHRRGVPARFPRSWRRPRQGSTYLLVLGVASVLTVIGLGALAVSRVNNRAASQSQDWIEAQLLAFSAVEQAMATINNTSNWRTAYNGQTVQKSLGRGSFTWRLADDEDGSLTDQTTDPFTVYAVGTVGRATYSTRTHVSVVVTPLPGLKTALCAGGNVTCIGAATTMGSGCLSANQTLTCIGWVAGDVQADRVRQVLFGGVTGTVTQGIDPLPMPDSGVFAMYQNLATPVTVSGTSLNNVTFSSTSNPLGSTNPDGVYYINTKGRNLTLTNCNVTGTLVVNCAPGTLTLGSGVNIANYRADYPALVVNGDAAMTFSTRPRPWGNNLRGGPLNANRRYWGWYNFWNRYFDTGQVVGLVHVKGDMAMLGTAGVEGCVICEGDVLSFGICRFDNDSSAWQNPPKGYGTGTITLKPDSWGRVVQ